MKSIIKQISSLIILVTIISLFSACKKTPDRPYISPMTSGGTITISQLRAFFAQNQGANYKFTQDISLYATVMMSDNYKTLYIKDNTGAISLKQLTAHGIFAGDSLRINLNGSWLDLSGTASSIQIDSVDVSDSPTCKVVKEAVGRPTPPMVVTIAQLNQSTSYTTYNGLTGQFFVPSSIYDGQLVQINDVQFGRADSADYINASTGALFYNSTLYDCGGLNSIIISLYSGTTAFQNQPKPVRKSGSIVAAVSFYNNALQLTPRSFGDVDFNQPRCGVDTLTQSFNNPSFGSSNLSALFPGWVTQRQVGYSELWVGASTSTSPAVSIASASLYGVSSSDTRIVTWLISPPIQNSPTKNLSFQVSTENNDSSINLLSVLVSTDYNGYNLGVSPYNAVPSSLGPQAHWTDITSSFVITTNGGSTSWYLAPPTSNYFSATAASTLIPSSYTGTFYIGFRYTANKLYADSSAGYGVANVKIRD
jgi:hypothetical protein